MSKAAVVISYILIVILFSILFKYGIHISFGIDTGFVGPIFIWHALLIITAMLRGSHKQ